MAWDVVLCSLTMLLTWGSQVTYTLTTHHVVLVNTVQQSCSMQDLKNSKLSRQHSLQDRQLIIVTTSRLKPAGLVGNTWDESVIVVLIVLPFFPYTSVLQPLTDKKSCSRKKYLTVDGSHPEKSVFTPQRAMIQNLLCLSMFSLTKLSVWRKILLSFSV